MAVQLRRYEVVEGSHPGDFEAAFEVFAASPERAAAFEGQPKRVGAMHVAMVETVIPHGG